VSDSLPPLELHGVRSHPARLFKLRGTFNGHTATLLLDSGASSEFIDPEFARRCGLTLTSSDRTVKLADGSIVAAQGRATADCALDAHKGTPVAFSACFTATPLEGYDAILGMTWLAAHDPLIGWADRTITLRTPGQPPRHIKPILDPNESSRVSTLASIGLNALRKAIRRNEILEVYAIVLKPTASDAAAGTQKEDPIAEKILLDFADVMPGKLPSGLPPTRGVQHRIDLKPGSRPPPVRPLRHQSPKDADVFQRYVRDLVENGQARESTSPYGAMALIVRKKDGTDRVVVDYRGLNEITVKNKYPLPLMDELFDRVQGAKFFTKLDLRTGFHQIRVAEEDVHKTAFRTRYGSFEFLVLPMGLCNAPGTFMALMNNVFRDMLDKSVIAFLDDILIFSRTKEEHETHVREVMTRLRAQQLYVKRSKCEFFRAEVEFLGHRIGADGLSVSQDKVQAVRDWPAPACVKDVRAFLGLAGFYRKFVKDFSRLAVPLTQLTKDDVPWTWGQLQREAFAALKQSLISAPVLLIPDPSLPYTLNCDACDYAIGGTLQQDHGHGLQPIAYRSRKLSDAEINYDTREKEFMALVDSCSHWRHYLHSDLPFTLRTDHDSLKYHKTMPNLSKRMARWIEKMAEFDYAIEYIPGPQNVVADALSRRADLKDALPLASAAALDDGGGPWQQVQRGRRGQRAAPAAPPADEAAQRQRNCDAAEKVQPVAADRPPPNAKGIVVMPSQRCTATNRNGAHCKQRTARGQFCWNHLRSIRGLRIKKSAHLPGAGMGLHADRDLPQGLSIDYTGDRVPLESDSDGGNYFLEIAQGVAIDAARTNSGDGRWVNDPRGSDKEANCDFVLYTPPGKQRTACVRTRRPVVKGEEILVKYGAQYWRFVARQARAKRAPRKRAQRRPALLHQLSEARVHSSLIDALTAAGQIDVEFAARLRSPPAGHDAAGGLLWNGTRLCVPNGAALRTRILAECHDSVTGAHFGRDKTLAAVKERFNWSGLAADVDRYVSTCDACQRNKPSQQATPGLLMPLPLPERPCLEWTQDAVTGLPKTRRGHDAIQVYVERLCKLKHFAASRKDAGAVELAASFVHTVVRAHGVPESIVSDRDPRFTAHFYAELTKLMGTTLRMSTARHPQSDGQSEREIRTLITALRSFCNEHQDDWDDYLDMLELGFNSSVQASTQRSPYELLYGVKPRLPIDVALASFVPRNPAALDRAERMQQALTFARDHLLTAQERQARNADRHRRRAAFSVGDSALLSTEGLQLRNFHNKLCSRFVGPFTVTAVVNANAYTLALPPQLQALHPTFNIDKLKRYRDGRALFPSRPQQHHRPPPVADADSNGDAEWEVERITASRRRGRGTEFLVAWKGYPPEENTWEPRSALRKAAPALAEFERSQRTSED